MRYEFDTKVSIASTIDEGFVVGKRALPGNPYDGQTLAEALEQVEFLTGQRPELAVVDRGYRGHGVQATRVLIKAKPQRIVAGLSGKTYRARWPMSSSPGWRPRPRACRANPTSVRQWPTC